MANHQRVVVRRPYNEATEYAQIDFQRNIIGNSPHQNHHHQLQHRDSPVADGCSESDEHTLETPLVNSVGINHQKTFYNSQEVCSYSKTC